MKAPARARTALLALLAVAAGCGGAPSCPDRQTCGAARWQPGNEAFAVIPVAEVGGVRGLAPGVTSDALPLGISPVYLRFEALSQLAQRRVARAVLSLSPHAAWRPRGERVQIAAAAVTGGWTVGSVASGGGPSLDDARDAVVAVPPGSRTPVRIDVTEAVRAWQSSGRGALALGLYADGEGVVFAGAGALEPSDRPRLEVALQ